MKSYSLKINNDKDAAIKTGKWSNPGAKFYDKLLNSYDSRWSHNGRNVFPEDEESKDWNYWEDFLKEAYLIAPVNDIKNSPHGRTPFSKSGCKYPHHEIRNGELVLSVPGVKAAYARAKQQGVYEGELKVHLERHMKELGDLVNFEEKIESNFDDIYMYILENTGIDLFDDIPENFMEMDIKEFTEKSHGSLKYCYRIGFDINTGKQVAVQFELDPDKITAVGDANLTNKVVDKLGMNVDVNNIHHDAIDKVKSSVRKKGHIDFRTEALKVKSIFYKNGKSIQEVSLIPLYSDFILTSISRYIDRFSHCLDDNHKTPNDIINRSSFPKSLVQWIKNENPPYEKYSVGTISGDNVYKTTKLIWNIDSFKSYRFTPSIRGFNKPGRGNDILDMKNYINSNLNNSYKFP